MNDVQLALNELQIQSAGYQERPVCIECSQNALQQELEQCQMKNATICLWMMQKIAWGTWNGSLIEFTGTSNDTGSAEYWQELRVFNDDAELHLKRYGDKLKGRFIRDAGQESREHVDSIARLWGECSSNENCLCLDDHNRKLHMELPKSEDKALYYGLVTRNYIGINPRTHQAGYVDYRFVRIASADI